MYYEINVSKKPDEKNSRQHVFATAPRSLTTPKDAAVVFALIDAKFPASGGYTGTVTKYETYGQRIDPTTLTVGAG